MFLSNIIEKVECDLAVANFILSGAKGPGHTTVSQKLEKTNRRPGKTALRRAKRSPCMLMSLAMSVVKGSQRHPPPTRSWGQLTKSKGNFDIYLHNHGFAGGGS